MYVYMYDWMLQVWLYVYMFDCMFTGMIVQGGPQKTIPKLNQIDMETNDIFRTNFNAY